MAVNQTQVDDIISAASLEDPAVRLQSLEREVDLLKISIKHILMDIRERMNELQNPFVIVSSVTRSQEQRPDTESQEAALDAREAALDAQESELAIKTMVPKPELPGEGHPIIERSDPAADVLVSPVPAAIPEVRATTRPGSREPPRDPLPLQKAYYLFSWTRNGVMKYGHSRLEILVETYRVMGYIGVTTAEEILQISHIMPLSPGEEQEIGPDEFVSEIYTLNRILTPHDTSLDRDMIEVMMNQNCRKQRSPEPVRNEAVPGGILHQESQEAFGFGTFDQRWMNLRA